MLNSLYKKLFIIIFFKYELSDVVKYACIYHIHVKFTYLYLSKCNFILYC